MTSSGPGPASRPAGSHRTLTVVIVALVAALLAGLIGLAAGGLGGFLVGNGSGGPGGDDRSAQNVAAACVSLENASADMPLSDQDTMTLDSPLTWELMAAGLSFQAAGAEDGVGDPLYEAGGRLVMAVQRLDIDMSNEAFDELITYCD